MNRRPPTRRTGPRDAPVSRRARALVFRPGGHPSARCPVRCSARCRGAPPRATPGCLPAQRPASRDAPVSRSARTFAWCPPGSVRTPAWCPPGGSARLCADSRLMPARRCHPHCVMAALAMPAPGEVGPIHPARPARFLRAALPYQATPAARPRARTTSPSGPLDRRIGPVMSRVRPDSMSEVSVDRWWCGWSRVGAARELRGGWRRPRRGQGRGPSGWPSAKP
ncbi:hypothetical protein BKA15_003726 [Microlunatus parietis]|uniref:Uncharacterized protein n=1 Tax=Microlunatus parietis TaxID=682979 RepID=A0A7Y9I8Z4_9ACTN|nr:hypothetical protein [Microlunatus parietis]